MRLSRLTILLVLLLPWTLWGQLNFAKHTQAELVANVESIQPGQPFWMALRLTMDEHWHTYWVNPGDAGLKTTLSWEELPEGFKAGEFHWPTPKRYLQEDIMNYVYEGEVFLMFEMTPPKDLQPGTKVTFKARADWLECDPSMCVPGGADVSLALPVQTGKPTPSTWANAFEKAQQNWPQDLTGSWSVSAMMVDGNYLLAFDPKEGASGDIGEVYYFDQNALITPSAPQPLTKTDRGYALHLEKNTFFDGDDKHLQGVLKTSKSWLADQEIDGMAVDVTIGKSSTGSITVTATAATPASAERGTPLLGLLGLAFLGGLILNLMPCVFPVLGLKIMGFVNQAGEDHGKVVAHGLVFTAGVLVSFWVLAGILIGLRAGGEELGWGFQLQSPGFVLALTVILLVFGLNMSGLFEIGTSAVGVGSQLTAKSGLSGSFFSGVLATVVATPCAAPFLAPALGAALTLPAAKSLAVFTTIGIGLALPYLLLSAFPQLIKALPKPGAWMETFKQAMAFLLYGTVVYLLWVLAGQLEPTLLLGVLFGLVAIACACWIYGRWAAPHRKPGTQWAARVVALLFFVAPLAYAYNGIAEQQRQAELKAKIASGEAKQDFLIWEPWSEEKVKELREAGRYVYIDFTARWCATCQVNKKAYNSPAVIDAFLANDVALLKADWTNHDPAITRALAGYGRSAVPFNLLYAPGKDEPIVMPEIFGAGAVLDTLKEAGAKVGG